MVQSAVMTSGIELVMRLYATVKPFYAFSLKTDHFYISYSPALLCNYVYRIIVLSEYVIVLCKEISF